jgi:hypothetical protein
MDAYLLECEWYCGECKPLVAEEYADGGGESDTPQHCHGCGKPLENTLTSEGVQYALEHAEEEARRPREERERIIPLKGTAEEDGLAWYKGEPHKRIVLDWLDQLNDYCLSKLDRARAKIIQRVLGENLTQDAEDFLLDLLEDLGAVKEERKS